MFFFPFRISIRRARRRSTQDQLDQASSGHKEDNPQPAPLLGYPPATGYGNIQEWADNVQPGANNSGSEAASQGNGDGNGNGSGSGSGNAGSQQPLLNPDGGNQQGNKDSNEEVQQGNSSGNEAPNNGNAGNEADKYKFGKRDAIRAFLLARLENFLIRAQTVRNKLARSRDPRPDDQTVPANELSPAPLPRGMGAAVPGRPMIVKHL